jgi:uncharacterized SAM-binding protein YcdF (DUF218 family)
MFDFRIWFEQSATAIRPTMAWPATGLVAAILLVSGWDSATSTLANILAQPLENRFQRADISHPSAFTGVIALGGGENRIREAGRLARQYPHLKVFISGAGPLPLILHLLGDGIEPDRIGYEDRSRSTYQNALFATAQISPRSQDRWLLVTSASHIPRAIGAFRKAGFDVEPWPVSDHASGRPLAFDVIGHEWLGLLAYRALDRTSEVFPSQRHQSEWQRRRANHG